MDVLTIIANEHVDTSTILHTIITSVFVAITGMIYYYRHMLPSKKAVATTTTSINMKNKTDEYIKNHLES